MSLVRISMATFVYLTAALFLALAIISCILSPCQAGNCIPGKPCKPTRKVACFVPSQSRRCSRYECPDVCSENGIKGCKAAYCNIKVIPYECCCPYY
ncbi:unnamed protein product [Urochloa decumbens]|uniref:Uncharacterized protein n=1 Tax=Urochloa decumbens TaxID=240449 RepID=A0ABC9BE54_9POAL